MLVVCLLTLSLHLCDSQLLTMKNNQQLSLCVKNVITNWFKMGSEITYVDLNFEDLEVIKIVHDMTYVTVISRTIEERIIYDNKAYVVMVNDYDHFKNGFELLERERDWKPNAYFLIAFKDIDKNALLDVFNDLLRYHIFDVVVIDTKNDAHAYSYNPFENYGCGNHFNKVLSYGKCSEANVTEFYFYKFGTGLKECTLNAAVSHWPPYIIDPKIGDDMVQIEGTEQYAMKILSELEGFKVNYIYTDDAEAYAEIDCNMKASGPLNFIQKGHNDIVFGGMLLNSNRAQAFSYIFIHPPFSDRLKVLVKKAGPVMVWRNMYLEFTFNVWILLIVTFVVFSALLVILFRLKDKCNVMLIMWNLLFQHGYKLHYKKSVQWFIFLWVVFAFLINIYYQSSLMGLTTRVSHNYQISKREDLQKLGIQPCVSDVINKFLKVVTRTEIINKTHEQCATLMSSVETVSRDYTKFTIVLYSIYNYNKLKFTDEFGDPLVYSFKKPVSNIIYAVYFYKGFPLVERLQTHASRIRESGLLDKHMRDLYYEKSRKVVFVKKSFQVQFINCWYVLAVGCGVSTVVIVLELLTYHIKKKIKGLIYY